MLSGSLMGIVGDVQTLNLKTLVLEFFKHQYNILSGSPRGSKFFKDYINLKCQRLLWQFSKQCVSMLSEIPTVVVLGFLTLY